MNVNFKKNRIKTTYFGSFILCIVIPILTICVVSVTIIRNMMLHSALDKIELAQGNVAKTLENEINTLSLRLSHLVHVNNNDVLELAVKTDVEDKQLKYYYTNRLMEAFNYIIIPNDDMIATVFYMKNGDYTFLKDDLSVSEDEIKSTDWYQEALEQTDRVKITSFQSNVTYSLNSKYQFTLAAVLAPSSQIDRSNKLEMVILFVRSKTDNLIKEYSQDPHLGTMFLTNSKGESLISLEEKEEEIFEAYTKNRKKGKKQKREGGYTYLETGIDGTDWRVASAINSDILLADFNKTAGIIIAIMVILFFLFYLFSNMFFKRIIHPVNELIQGLKQVENGSLDVHIPISGQSEIRTMIHSFNRMVRRLKVLIHNNEQSIRMKHEAEIRALQSQINPHFLVNSLSSIRFMAQVSKFDSIKNMAEALMKILSCSFRKNGSFYTVKEELEMLESYIFLMRVRYADGFEYSADIQELCLGLFIPRLILQPIVENCIVHGFSDMEELGRIKLTVYEKEEKLYIEIKDNGKGIPEEKLKLLLCEKREEEDNYNIGISNVYSRLKLYYKDNCQMKIESQLGEYTKTTIVLPRKQTEKREDEHVSGDVC